MRSTREGAGGGAASVGAAARTRARQIAALNASNPATVATFMW